MSYIFLFNFNSRNLKLPNLAFAAENKCTYEHGTDWDLKTSITD